MSNAYIIEPAGTPVGLAIAERNHFRFVALDPRFDLLDGSQFRNLAAAESAARRVLNTLNQERRRRAA